MIRGRITSVSIDRPALSPKAPASRCVVVFSRSFPPTLHKFLFNVCPRNGRLTATFNGIVVYTEATHTSQPPFARAYAALVAHVHVARRLVDMVALMPCFKPSAAGVCGCCCYFDEEKKKRYIYPSAPYFFFFLSHCGFQTIRSPTSRNPQNTLKLTVPAFVPSLARLLARTILQTELVEAVALPEAKQNVWHKRCRLSSLKAEKGSPLSDLQSAKRWTWLTVSLWRKMWSGRPLTLSRRAHR